MRCSYQNVLLTPSMGALQSGVPGGLTSGDAASGNLPRFDRPIHRTLAQEDDQVHEGERITEIDDTRDGAAFARVEGRTRNRKPTRSRMSAESRPAALAQAQVAMDALFGPRDTATMQQRDNAIGRQARTRC